jgi:hypothetical protein
MARRRSLGERFWSRVDKSGECWLWTGSRNAAGYGRTSVNDKTTAAHRVSLLLAGVDIAGKIVRHICDNPPCVNPAHLRIGTQSENIVDMYQKGRANVPTGQRHHFGRKTHCVNGHPFTPENIYWRTAPLGTRARACRECRRINGREHMRRVDPEKRRKWKQAARARKNAGR